MDKKPEPKKDKLVPVLRSFFGLKIKMKHYKKLPFPAFF
jgi:hypothetical protein